MRTERATDGEATSDASLSRRSFVVAGGTTAGTVVVGGVASGDDGGAPIVGATEPYVPAAREAASDAASPVQVRPAASLDDSPDVLVSGHPEAGDGGHDVHEAVVDGQGALTNPEGTWRRVLSRSDVRDRWSSESAVETFSEVDGHGAGGIGSLERPGGSADDAAALVRGTRAYQYAEGRGGVGYYDVDAEAIADAADGTEDEAAVQVVRLGYVHADPDSVDDERVSTFLDSYGTRVPEANGGSSSFVDPAVQ
ncbi:hypothetical protein HWV07_01980 [Natronomonas salina]|uniref:hypothetical protein n=1 Tax=Natronomonas salina TaxID=1710540 RepID=UPI0015B6B953|nr:hypothetical protein [Natronomonas salina]QLD87870.1 hypothetical protein HWV07_01980 [Natronomonas salina]